MVPNDVRQQEQVLLRDEATKLLCAREYAKSLTIWRTLIEFYAHYLSSDDLYNASLAARYTREFELADIWLSSGIESYPEETRFWLDSAKLAMNQNDWQLAIRRFELIPKKFYSENVARFHGLTLYRAGEMEAAIEVLSAAFVQHPDNLQLLVDCEHIYQQTSNLDVSIGIKIQSLAKSNNIFSQLQALTAPADVAGLDIVHLMHPAKFSWEYLAFANKNKLSGHHLFMMLDDGNVSKWPLTEVITTFGNCFIDHQQALVQLVNILKHSRIIILHSLFNHMVLEALYQNQDLLSKCYWFIWGSDLHIYKSSKSEKVPNKQKLIAQSVIKKMGYIVCHNIHNYQLAKDYYATEAEYICGFKYESNMCEVPSSLIEVDYPFLRGGAINILVGNSASLANDHSKMFQLIAPYKDEDILVVCPLNYGDPIYASHVQKLGKQYFGDKFVALKDDIAADEYFTFLSKMDIGLFCHNPDQGMGTIRRLLSLGKKVFVNKDHGANFLIKQFGITLFDAEKFDLQPTFKQQQDNVIKMRQHYSKQTLIDSLNGIFHV